MTVSLSHVWGEVSGFWGEFFKQRRTFPHKKTVQLYKTASSSDVDPRRVLPEGSFYVSSEPWVQRFSGSRCSSVFLLLRKRIHVCPKVSFWQLDHDLWPEPSPVRSDLFSHPLLLLSWPPEWVLLGLLYSFFFWSFAPVKVGSRCGSPETHRPETACNSWIDFILTSASRVLFIDLSSAAFFLLIWQWSSMRNWSQFVEMSG